MPSVVLVAFLVQSVVGVRLLIGWRRHARGAHTGLVVMHVTCALVSLAVWVVFLASGAVVWAWLAFAVVTAANVFGDMMLVRRAHRLGTRGYGAAIATVFRGKLPPSVTFHALFAGVVYFTCLGVCIGATLAAA